MRRLSATAVPSGSYPRKGPFSLSPVSSAKKPKNENGDGTKMAIKWDEDFDVICVGSGLGGLSAALTAAQRGARAIVLEKFELLGGVSALSRSDERRVGKEGVSTCRSRWAPYHEKTNKKIMITTTIA